MTAEELMEFAYRHVHTMPMRESTSELILALRDKLKEAITPNQNELCIVWDVGAVQRIAKDHGYSPLTLEQAQDVLALIGVYYDEEYGIKTDNVCWAIEDILEIND